MDVTPELLSRYVDGQTDADETRAVEQAIGRDPALQGQLEDLKALGELFGEVEPEEVSDALTERLYALDQARPLEAFEVVRQGPAPTPLRWRTWAAAAAVLALLIVGVARLTEKPEVILRDFAVATVGARGEMVELNRLSETTVRAGDVLRTAADERISFRTVSGDRVTLLPGGALEIGDPREGQVFELHRGTVLCSLLRLEEPRRADAGPYRLVAAAEAHFGVRLEGADVKPMGAAKDLAAVTVTVSKGAVEVSRNGLRREVRAFERVVLRQGREVEATHAAADPLFGDLMRSYRLHSRELVPGYFTGEPGVQPVAQPWMRGDKGEQVLVLSDEGALASRATHLVLYARAARPGAASLTRVRPLGEGGRAEAATVETGPLGTSWTVVAVPLAAFRGEAARRETRNVPAGMDGLVRLEIRPAEQDNRIEIKTSLWAERPPLARSEVVR